MAGRPTKYTPELGDRFIGAIRRGNTIANACALAGINTFTFYNWQHYARTGGPNRGLRAVLIEFIDAYRKAEALALNDAVEEVRRAGQGTASEHRTVKTIEHPNGNIETVTEITYQPPEWRASAWYLERRQPRQWGRRDRTPVDMEQEAERLARELNIPVEDLWAEAELIAQTEG